MHKNKLKQNQAYMRARIYHSQMCSLPGQWALKNIERSPPTNYMPIFKVPVSLNRINASYTKARQF